MDKVAERLYCLIKKIFKRLTTIETSLDNKEDVLLDAFGDEIPNS